jgi:RHS repeat-associated protein
MNRLPAFVLRCLLWACLFVGSRSAEGSFPKSSPPCPVTVTLPDPVAFTHDARGNLLNDGQPLLAYDAEDQLTSIRVPPTATAAGWETQFVYDGLGRLRIRREITVPATGSTTTRTTNQVRYLYDGFTAVQERDGNNAVLATYTRGNDLSGTAQGAGGIGGLLARTDVNGNVFYHADAGGNVTTLFNASQAVVGRYAYDPFGNLLGMSGTNPVVALNRYRFSSKEVHPQTGMYYYGFRFYEPNLQRWTSRDPIEEMGGLNLYGFVGNGPMDGIDPFGLLMPDRFEEIERILRNNAADFQHFYPTPQGGIGIYNYEPGLEPSLLGELLLPGGGLFALGPKSAFKFCATAAKTAEKQLTVIGHLKPPTGPGYAEVAESLGANYLKPSANWNWQKQGDFIKSVIERGDDVLIGTPIRPGDSVLRHEIKQLIKAGYEPAEQGSKRLIKRTP